MFKRGGIYAVSLPHADTHEPEVCPCLVVSNNISKESGMGKKPETDDAYNQMKIILSSAPATLSALSLDTTGFKFDREEANAR
jgi:hypothetical protein